MLITASDFIKAIRYQNMNDPRLSAKLQEHEMSLEKYILAVIDSRELRKAYREQYRLWKREEAKNIKQTLALIREAKQNAH